jgi:hypothetical protein
VWPSDFGDWHQFTDDLTILLASKKFQRERTTDSMALPSGHLVTKKREIPSEEP